MKILTLLVLFMILTTSMLFGEGLGTNAQKIKEHFPAGYETIKTVAVDVWGNNHSMILFQINTESDSLVVVMDLILNGGDLDIFASAVDTWSVHGSTARNVKIVGDLRSQIEEWTGTGDISDLYTMAVSWSMILFEYEMQVSAASSY